MFAKFKNLLNGGNNDTNKTEGKVHSKYSQEYADLLKLGVDPEIAKKLLDLYKEDKFNPQTLADWVKSQKDFFKNLEEPDRIEFAKYFLDSWRICQRIFGEEESDVFHEAIHEYILRPKK